MTIDSSEDLLKEIRAAFPASAYPGDATLLGDCRCEECEWSVHNLRGKSWMQLLIEDMDGEGNMLSHEAFRYYLPGLLCLAVQHPVESMLECVIIERLSVFLQQRPAKAEAVTETVCQLTPMQPDHANQLDKVDSVTETVRQLTPMQRGAVERFLRWVGGSDLHAPIVIEAALQTVRDGRVARFDIEEVMRWNRLREAARKGS